ncbi:uncharacterized protein [Diabrotica undecimpunctata]|uniref:uncharacterized protein n=1 Tax=Diabrotica undecimpunctata TaxID=50387 RepID=UPI003B632A43
MDKNYMWTIENDEILIDYVRKNEALYNIKHKDYRKSQLKQNLWEEIGAHLETTGIDCSKRWAYVRDYYIRRRGKLVSGTIGEAAKKRSAHLTFLDSMPSVQRKSTTNFVGVEFIQDEADFVDEEQADNKDNTFIRENKDIEIIYDEHYKSEFSEDCNNEEESVVTDILKDKKRKMSTKSDESLALLKSVNERNNQDEVDETDLFFQSMAKIVKKLPWSDQAKLRMEISTLVSNAELNFIYNHTDASS